MRRLDGVNDAESIALEFQHRTRLDTGEPVHPFILAKAAGLTLVPTAPRGCRGMTIGGIIRYDGSLYALLHEIAHVACDMAGLPRPHCERLVASVASRLAIPLPAFRRGIRSGATRAALARAFNAKETCIALRRGESTGEPVAVITRTRVLAAGEWCWPAEDVLRRQVQQRSKWLRTEQLGDDRRRTLVTLAENAVIP